MTAINLKQQPNLDQLVRIQVMPQGHWTDTSQPWVDLPMGPRIDINGVRYWGNPSGVELELVERACLPDIGAAVFHMDFGLINGTTYDTDDNGNILSAWDLMLGGAGHDVRISVADPPQGSSVGFTPTWTTVFLGTVVSQDDDVFPGDATAGGRRTWRCSDLLWRTSRWPMNRHHNYNDGLTETHAEGHPGYNYACQGYYRRLIGNREATGVSADPYGDMGALSVNYLAHTFAGIGAASIWTDLQAVNHALACSRSKGEPMLEVSGATTLLSLAKFVWPVQETDVAWDMLTRILARQRGRGIGYLDWTTSGGNVLPKITVAAQTAADITANPPGGSPIVFPGAYTNGTNVAVNLNGDQRVVENSVQITKNDTGTCDYLESEGEPLEILVTLSPGDGSVPTLAKRWASNDETAFAALDSSKPWLRNSSRWQYVWQRWGLPPGFDWRVYDGNNGVDKGSTSGHSINWRCKDDGTLALGTPANPSESNSKTVTRIMSDLPLYEGYDYTANATTRYDGAAQNTELYAPPRLRPLVMINYAQGVAGATYIDAVQAIGAGLANDDFGLLLPAGDQSIGQRPWSGVNGPAGGVYDPKTLTVTVGLQLSNRVRMASATIDPATSQPWVREKAPRRRSLRFPGVFLWLADPAAIWSIYDASNNANNQTAKRLCAGGTISSDGLTIVPGILRDDRASLAQLHALAWSWYSAPRFTGQWQIRGCGLSPSFPLQPSGSQTYPTIGQVVTSLLVARSYNPNTPITRVRWDALAGVTTWVIDWNELDLNQ